MVVNGGKIAALAQKLYDTLTGIQWGTGDPFGWVVKAVTLIRIPHLPYRKQPPGAASDEAAPAAFNRRFQFPAQKLNTALLSPRALW